MDPNYKRLLQGLIFFATAWLLYSWIVTTQKENKQKFVVDYLKSPQFIKDFSNKEYQQEVLVSYPKIIRYFTDRYSTSTEFSEIQKQDADASQCDFIYELFRALKVKRPRDKIAILDTLKQQNIQLEQIYRNQAAVVVYSSQIRLQDCQQWYADPNRSQSQTTNLP